MTKRVAWISFTTTGRACVEAATEVAGIVTPPGPVLGHRADGVLVACGEGGLVVQEASVADGVPLVGAPLQNLLREGAILG